MAAGLLVLVALLGLIGPAITNPRPHDLPVGLVGPAPAVEQLSSAIGSKAPGAFTFTSYPGEDEARTAIDDRTIDAALVLSDGPRLIVAGAAGDPAIGAITAVFTAAFRAQGQTLSVETVHPFASADPHGLILFFVVLAVLISAVIAGALVAERVENGFAMQLLVVVLFALLAAPVALGMATWIAGDFGSGVWMAGAFIALTSAALGMVVVGAARLLGRPGIALAALVLILLDLVSSGGPLGSEFLPDVYRWLAPAMPARQLYAALRGALYFNNGGLATPAVVLGMWLGAGVVLMLLGQLVSRRSARGAARLVPAR
jgi:hypothetical protein